LGDCGPLPGRLRALLSDPGWAMDHFTLAADLTFLRQTCQFACSEQALVARYEGLPFAALAFWGDEPLVVARLAAELVEPDESFFLVLNAEQAQLAAGIFEVVHADPEWQMCFEGGGSVLDGSGADELTSADLPAMQTLAGGTGLMALEQDPFRYGPAYGVWVLQPDERQPTLVSMATTHLRITGAAEIGSVGTLEKYRRRGLARRAVSGLVRAHLRGGQQVFLMVFQKNETAARFYEDIGFMRRCRMVLMQCRIAPGAGLRSY